MLFLEQILHFYTQDEEVVDNIRPVLKISCVFFVIDIVQNVGAQFYKPLGFGQWVTKVYTFSFYLCGFGTTVLLARVLDSKIFAAWGGLFVGAVVLGGFCLNKYQQFDMRELVTELNSKVKNEKEIELPLIEVRKE